MANFLGIVGTQAKLDAILNILELVLTKEHHMKLNVEGLVESVDRLAAKEAELAAKLTSAIDPSVLTQAQADLAAAKDALTAKEAELAQATTDLAEAQTALDALKAKVDAIVPPPAPPAEAPPPA